jgi:predicted  nucleic acid-binding Zn-ribbon protein
MTQAGLLLELQALDLELLRSAKKLDELPEKRAILAARAKIREVQTLRGKADLLVAKLKSDLKGHQDEIATLTDKIAVEQTKVMNTTDHRAVTSITREMDGLKRRRDKLEMESLQLMERIDKAKSQTATIDDAIANLIEKEAGLVAQFRTVGGALQTHIATEEKKRAAVAKKLPAELLKRYESLRESRGGVGVGELDGETCSACRMVLPAERVRSLIGGDDIGTCPQCRRMIVVHHGGGE